MVGRAGLIRIILILTRFAGSLRLSTKNGWNSL